MRSSRLSYEVLTVEHAAELHPVLATPAVLARIDRSGSLPTLADTASAFARRAAGAGAATDQRWYDVVIRSLAAPYPAIGRLEATVHDGWGELAYLLGEAWWGQGLAYEAMRWWHGYLEVMAPGTVWWAATHPSNARSLQLLHRLGYREAEGGERPPMGSYDPGDRCFSFDGGRGPGDREGS
jgi:RimJ/RimL family protein N-acetyltransferase